MRKSAINNLNRYRTMLNSPKNYDTPNKKLKRLAQDKTSFVLPIIQPCKKCNQSTYFAVTIIDRQAAWCGCK